jgi:hypothetical protein
MTESISFAFAKLAVRRDAVKISDTSCGFAFNICKNVPHVGDWRRWRQLSKQVLPWRSKKLATPFDPYRNSYLKDAGTKSRCSMADKWPTQLGEMTVNGTAFCRNFGDSG